MLSCCECIPVTTTYTTTAPTTEAKSTVSVVTSAATTTPKLLSSTSEPSVTTTSSTKTTTRVQTQGNCQFNLKNIKFSSFVVKVLAKMLSLLMTIKFLLHHSQAIIYPQMLCSPHRVIGHLM